MTCNKEPASDLLEAMNGSHLSWSDFRQSVLQSYRIRCKTGADLEQLPTTFIARLQASLGNLSKHDSQRQAWRLDCTQDRGFGTSTIFPPNITPPAPTRSEVVRCMQPKMGREGLPSRMPSTKSFLYELPTAKPMFVSGFKMDAFEKAEQAQLAGGLSVTGTVVDFSKAEVVPGKILCCPFLTFEKFASSSEQHIEAARNACAITGSQCLRAQQQLLHKAFGLQQVAQPPITFTCALNNHNAVINWHYVDGDGNFTMTALCKFNLEDNGQYNMFQAWIEAIESWAATYLLPRIKGAANQVVQSNPSPPPSPTPTTSSSLSIDTTSDNFSTILSALRRTWPMIPWQRDTIGETPINSSIANCGTPFPARQVRTISLPQPGNLGTPCLVRDGRFSSAMSQRLSDVCTPIHTDLPLSARPQSQTSIHLRRMSSANNGRRPLSAVVTSSPLSPCRPPSLSPCTPLPDMPTSSRSPMLVLQKRLDIAMNEIQELRSVVDDLQGLLSGKTETLERRLEVLTEKQDETEKFIGTPRSARLGTTGVIRGLEALAEDDSIMTPIAMRPGQDQCVLKGCMVCNMPGHYLAMGEEKDLSNGIIWVADMVFTWCLSAMVGDETALTGTLFLVTVVLCLGRIFDPGDTLLNLAFNSVFDCWTQQQALVGFWRILSFYKAIQEFEQQRRKRLNAASEEHL